MIHADRSRRPQAAWAASGTFALSMALIVVTVPPAGAQWLDHRTPGIPRTADGKLDADAPAPRTAHGTPDLSGLWRQPVPPGYVIDIAADLPADAVAPIASHLYEQRLGELGKDDPATIGCLPSGPRHIIGGSTADIVRIVQTPTLIVMVFESLASRQIHLDGRSLPKDPNPSFMGYSVGRWEGDTLVVETIGFNGRTWLDFGGHPHGDRLKTVERFRLACPCRSRPIPTCSNTCAPRTRGAAPIWSAGQNRNVKSWWRPTFCGATWGRTARPGRCCSALPSSPSSSRTISSSSG
jgi:hypothetical protein